MNSTKNILAASRVVTKVKGKKAVMGLSHDRRTGTVDASKHPLVRTMTRSKKYLPISQTRKTSHISLQNDQINIDISKKAKDRMEPLNLSKDRQSENPDS